MSSSYGRGDGWVERQAISKQIMLVGLLGCLAWMDGDPLRPTPTAHAFVASGAFRAPGGDDWVARLEASIAEREYRVRETDQGLQAPNRRHDLRTYFHSDGIRVVDRTASETTELLGLELVGIGRGTALRSIPPGKVLANGAQVEIRRPGLVEWFVNGPDGLEQGFTIAERADGEANLHLVLALVGAKANPQGEKLVFETPAGRKLSYGKLAAWDARGVPLPARFDEAEAGQISLSIDDSEAQYPIVIDPLLTATPDTHLSGFFPSFGADVASAGDVNGDGYDDVIVGAPEFDGGQAFEGAAFVFLGGANGIADAAYYEAHATLESDQTYAGMGNSVASAGDVNGDGYADVLVGAPQYADGQALEGAAFIYLGSADGIVSRGNPANAHARIYGDRVLAHLGSSVASAGDVNGDGYDDVIVAANGYSDGESFEGAAFVFLGSASGVSDGSPASAHASFEGDQVDARLSDASCAGDVNGDGFSDVILGAEYYDIGHEQEGAAFLFLGSANGLAGRSLASADALIAGDEAWAGLGGSVASAGDVNGDGFSDVIVGSIGYGGAIDGGAAFIFLGSASGSVGDDPASAHTRLVSDVSNSWFGNTVASAGDVNGDGYADVLVTAPQYQHQSGTGGKIFLFLGSENGVASGDPASAAMRITCGDTSDTGGASAGDVNGDGYADVIVGAGSVHCDSEIPVPHVYGKAHVFHGAAEVPEPRLPVALALGSGVIAELGKRRRRREACG